MIELHDVRARYHGASGDVLAGVSLRAPSRGITAVVGPNGSGKSTVVRAILGRVPVTGGEVRVDGLERRGMSQRELARRVAVVTQREETVFARRVSDYIAMGALPHATPIVAAGAAADSAAVITAAARAGVSDLLARRTDELSGGEWQRVRIARALVQDAHTLVLDEPTAFLDIAHEMQVFELLAALAADGAALLVVSHNVNLVARFATSVVLLHEGRVAASGPPRDVMRGDVLERVYAWPLLVTVDPATRAPSLVPLRKQS